MAFSNVLVPEGATHQSTRNFAFYKLIDDKLYIPWPTKRGIDWFLYANYFHKFPKGAFIELR